MQTIITITKSLNTPQSSAPLGAAPSVVKSTQQKTSAVGAACEIENIYIYIPDNQTITGRIYEAPDSIVIDVLQTVRSDGAKMNCKPTCIKAWQEYGKDMMPFG